MGSGLGDCICRKASILAAVGLIGLSAAASASAYSAAPGYVASDYATGFLTGPHGWGPLGLAFDQSDNLYVADNVDGRLYRFGPGGGRASAALIGDIPDGPGGMAVTPDGSLYATRFDTDDVVEIDTTTGGVIRTIATGIACPTGLAVDPISGDLFVSQNECGATIFRIGGYRDGPGTVTPYAMVPNVDGLAFARDGTLYAESAGTIYRVTGTSNPGPPTTTPIANVPAADGLALGEQRAGAPLPFLVANRTDGTVTRVDLGSQSPSGESNILTGGSRGDFVAVDSRGCLYATQSDRVVKIAPADGKCQLVPSTPGIQAQSLSQLALQCTTRPLVLIDVVQHGNHVYLLGAADRHLIGRRVQIFSEASGKAVATAVVDDAGFFHTTAPLPPASVRGTNRARYEARTGGDRSLDLKLRRRMEVRSVTARGGIVTIRGHVVGPLATPPAPIFVERRVSCSRYVTVTRVAARRDGSFTAAIPAPPAEQVGVYRAATFVRKGRTNAKRFPTFTLPRYVALD